MSVWCGACCSLAEAAAVSPSVRQCRTIWTLMCRAFSSLPAEVVLCRAALGWRLRHAADRNNTLPAGELLSWMCAGSWGRPSGSCGTGRRRAVVDSVAHVVSERGQRQARSRLMWSLLFSVLIVQTQLQRVVHVYTGQTDPVQIVLHTHTHTHTLTHTHPRTHTHADTQTQTDTRTQTDTDRQTHTHAHTHAHAGRQTHTPHRHAHTHHTHTDRQTDTHHTHTHRQDTHRQKVRLNITDTIQQKIETTDFTPF